MSAGGSLCGDTDWAKNPLTSHIKPLLAIDVCERAYYLDFRNWRGDCRKGAVDRLFNRQFADEILQAV